MNPKKSDIHSGQCREADFHPFHPRTVFFHLDKRMILPRSLSFAWGMCFSRSLRFLRKIWFIYLVCLSQGWSSAVIRGRIILYCHLSIRQQENQYRDLRSICYQVKLSRRMISIQWPSINPFAFESNYLAEECCRFCSVHVCLF